MERKQQLTNVHSANIECFHYSAFLTSPTEVRDYLSGSPHSGTIAMRCGPTLFVRNSDKIYELDVSEMRPEDFTGTANSKLASAKQAVCMLKSSSLAHRILPFPVPEYSFKILAQGQAVVLEKRAVTVFVLSDRAIDYFDLQVLARGEQNEMWQPVNYLVKEASFMTHSGDLVGRTSASVDDHDENGSVQCPQVETLHHWVNLDLPPQGQCAVVQVVGFRNHLRLFGNHTPRPLAMVEDRQRKIIYIIPLPLDPATIGDSRLANIATITPTSDGESLRVVVLSNPYGVPGVSTNEMTNSVLVSASRAQALGQQFVPQETVLSKSITTASRVRHGSNNQTHGLEPGKPLLFFASTSEVQNIQHVNDLFRGLQPYNFTYSTSLVLIPRGQSPTAHCKKSLVLPLASSMEMSGGAILGACDPLAGNHGFTSLDDWHNKLDSCLMPVVLCSHDMKDAATEAVQTQLNALFLVPVPLDDSMQGKATSEILRLVDISAMSSMRGPYSIVLVILRKRLYWMTGVRFPGLMDHHPDFGQDVTDMFTEEKLLQYAKSGGMGHCLHDRGLSVVWQKGAQTLHCPWIKGTSVYAKDVCDELCKLGLDMYKHMENEIRDLLASLCVVASSIVVRDLSMKLTQHLNKLIKGEQQQYLGNMDICALDQMVCSAKSSQYKRRHGVRWLIGLLGSMTSASGARRYGDGDLEGLMKRLGVNENVEAVHNMTQDRHLAWINEQAGDEDHSDEDRLKVLMMAWPGTSSRGPIRIGSSSSTSMLPILESILSSVANSQFLDFLSRNHCVLCDHFDVNERALLLQSETFSLLIEHSGNHENMPMRPSGADSASMFVPQSHHQTTTPNLGLFIERSMTILANPSCINWVMEACKPSITNRTRILMVKSIASAWVARRSRAINPRDPDCRQLIVWVLLATLRNFVRDKAVPDSNEESGRSTVRDIARGIMYHVLCASASGSGKPLMYIWQLVGENSTPLEPIPKGEALFYLLLLECYPHTAWPLRPVQRNVARLLVMMVKRALVDPVTRPMAERAKASQVGMRKQAMEARQKQLRWLDLATHVVLEVAKDLKLFCAKTRSIFGRLQSLAPCPCGQGSGGYNMVLRFAQIAASDQATQKQFETVQKTLCNISAKRSGAFGPTKKEIAETLKKKDPVKAQQHLKEIERLQQHLGSGFGVVPGPEECKVQNLENIRQAVASGDFRPAKADAEINRGWYSLSKEPNYGSKEVRDNDVCYVMTGERKAMGEQSTASNQAVQEEDSVPKGLRKYAGHEDALGLYYSIPLLNIAGLMSAGGFGLHDHELVALFAHAGVNEADVNDTIGQVVAVLIREWKDPIRAQWAAVDRLLKSE